MTLARIAMVAATLCAWPALADPPAASRPGMEKLHEACAKDIDQYCGTVTPGRGAVARCLHENEDKLSDACKAARAEARSHIQRKTEGQ